MIQIYIENTFCCIYNIDDWKILRCKYRIIGELLGDNFCIPSLPLRLLPEETLLLLRKGVAKLVQCSKRNLQINLDKESYIEFESRLLKEQKSIYEDVRKNQIKCIQEKIINGKRKQGDKRSKEEIIKEQLNKAIDVNKDIMLWPTFCYDLNNQELIEISENDILKQTTISKFNVFMDLWEKGYYITSGNKFGGDYLLYIGDPILHHSLNIVHYIKNSDENYNASELVCISRLGTSVKKRTVLATVKDQGVIYITLNWIDI